ncbi:polymer-forming cytoskeletal protein [Candidatus Uhrbacteria bacterium]|jgi:hypothetical protein|nr:polymer-forming cytoskeletal protein [Candidatus Uhrbacteria bacterium]MBT7717336.1 polymer-forming cytoskeletal protein [Candidatus Uhrbacteria bacterium]
MKNVMKVSLMLFIALSLPITASAAYFESGEQVSVNEAMSEDVYVAASMVTVSAPVSSDVFVAGASVNVTSDVSEDLFAAGSQVIITGDIAGDARIGGSSVIIGGNIGDELFAAGSLVQVTSEVQGDAHIGAAAVIIDGTIHGDLVLGAGSAIINGTVLGNVVAYVDEITIGSGAQIDGILTYHTDEEVDFGDANISEVVFVESVAATNVKSDFGLDDISGPLSALSSLALFIKFLGILVISMIVGLVWPKTASLIADRSTKKFAISLMTGLVTVIVVPVATILLLISAIGWPFATALAPAACLLTIIATAYTGTVLGNVIIRMFKKQSNTAITWYGILLGVVLMSLLTLIPIIGWLAVCIVYVTVLGSILGLLYDQVQKLK